MLTPYAALRAEAFPFARRIVDFEGYWQPWFNAADIAHRIELHAGAIASTAVTRGHSVEQTVARTYPELFGMREVG